MDELAEDLLDGAAVVGGHVLETHDTSDTRLEYMSARNCDHLLEAFLRKIGEARGLLRCGAGLEIAVASESAALRSLRLADRRAGGMVAERCVASIDGAAMDAVLHAPVAQARDHFALDREMAQQVVELHGEGQEIVARQGLLVAQRVERRFEALGALAHRRQRQARGARVDAADQLEDQHQLLAERLRLARG